MSKSIAAVTTDWRSDRNDGLEKEEASGEGAEEHLTVHVEPWPGLAALASEALLVGDEYLWA